MIPGILVAGIGNIFLGDDAFGSEVARRLAAQPQPDGVRVVDFGIRGFDLTYALLDGPETVILVDAAARGEAPGTLSVIEPDLENLDEPQPRPETGPILDAHAMDPLQVLRAVRSMGGRFHRVLLVACEPESFGTEDEGEGRMALSAPVAAAVEEAARLIAELVVKIQVETVEVVT